MKALIHKLDVPSPTLLPLSMRPSSKGRPIYAPVFKKGLDIIQGLRGHTTGYAIPQYVIDAPGGGGKVPINPDYILKRDRQG